MEISDVFVRELLLIGIDYFSEEWVFKSHGKQSVADKIVVLRWHKLLIGFDLSDDNNFNLGQLLKKIAACFVLGLNNRAYSPSTVKNKITWIRGFFLALETSGYKRLSLVTSAQVHNIFCRYQKNVFSGKSNSVSTVKDRMNVVSQIYRMKKLIGDGFFENPFPEKFRRKMSTYLAPAQAWEAPPEPICIYLLKSSIRFVDVMAESLLSMFYKYVEAVEGAKDQGLVTKKKIAAFANAMLMTEKFPSSIEFDAAINDLKANKPNDVACLINHLQTACFIIISYTSGPRVSEIRRASTKSLKYVRHIKGQEFPYYYAARSKKRFSGDRNVSTAMEDESPWILSPAGVIAFGVLKRLSERARLKSGKDNLWLVTAGNALWPFNARRGYEVISSSAINRRLNMFAVFLNLKSETGWEGTLHSHMGRKHFARFVAKRDRTALGDLAIQYSHTSAHSVDISYAKPDSEFRRLLKDELNVEMESVALELAGLSTEQVYHNAGDKFEERTIAKFIGQMRSMREVRMLLARGTILVPCQWGVCMYRQETSACQGSKQEPNPENRSPTTCIGCLNFIATPRHRLWWENYKDDSVSLLRQSNIPQQTRIILMSRLEECERVLEKI